MAEFILKDWHGKEQSFDEETIYVKNKEGKLLPFTHGTGNPVIEPLEVTENGTYEAPAGVDGYSPVTVEAPDPVINKLEVTKNGTYAPQAGVDGYGPVVVNVPAVVRSLEVTENGTYTAPSGVDGYSPVTVNVPDNPPVLQAKEATKNGEYKPDSGYDGLSKVTVNVPDPVLEPLNVTVNGNYTPGSGKDGFNSVTVAVPAPEIKLQEKTITENGEYTADSGFDGLGKVTVEVAGSGGGSLPAGIYWSYGEYCQPSQYYQKWFLYNGNLYVMANTASNIGDTYNLFKFVNGEWTTVISKGTITAFSQPAGKPFIDFGGKIHMIDSGGTFHYIFDGTSFTKKSNCPSNLLGSSAFVQDGKLKVYSYANGTVYVWNETTDTWTSEATIEAANSYYYFCNVGNDVYYNKNTALYKYENGASVQVATLSVSPTHKFEYKSCLYYFYNYSISAKNRYRTEWYKYDFNTGTETMLGFGPYAGNNYNTIELQDKLYFIHGNPAANTFVCSMHKVTE